MGEVGTTAARPGREATVEGTVISVNGDMLDIKMKRHAACEKCGACITLSADAGEMLITARNKCGAGVGDSVAVEVAVSGFLKASLLMYALPCVLFIAGLFIGHLAGSDALGFIIGSLLVAGVYIYARKNRRMFQKEEYTPAAVMKL